MRRFIVPALLLAAFVLAKDWRAGPPIAEPRAVADGREQATLAVASWVELPPARRYAPIAGEPAPNAKRLAARVVEALFTYDERTDASAIRRRIDGAAFARAVRRTHVGGTRSVANVIYPQLSGYSARTAGVMVVVRQSFARANRPAQSVIRVVDVRLRLNDGGRWKLQRVGSLGGSPGRSRSLTAVERRALDHPAITWSDSARWDIERGGIDPALLRALVRTADRRPIAVAVLRSGHPVNVWGTDRRSAHADGLAADIYKVSGRLVVRRDQAARQAASQMLDNGAHQVGAPWDLGKGRRSFTDVVHRDHLHLHQRTR